MREAQSIVRISTGIYRLLLKAYPRSFRREFGDEMVDVFSDLLTDAVAKRGRTGAVLTWCRVVRDLSLSVAEQHRIALRRRLRMAQKTWLKPFLAGACTATAVMALVMATTATIQSARASAALDRARQAAAAAAAAREILMEDGGEARR